jgi:REP element-mobilizing transposase RayT
MALAMTAPRQVLAGTTYLVSNRCLHRLFFLKPSKVTSDVFLYLLAVAAERYGIEVHAYCVMSNHYHLVVTDPFARLPGFEQYLDGLLARVLNSALGRRDVFWGLDSYSAVSLASPRDVVDKAAYTLANPVAAGLVKTGRRWPGLWSCPEDIGGAERQVPRPARFFSPDGNMPKSVAFRLTVPPGFASAEAFREQLNSELATRETAAAKQVGHFLGAKRVLAQKVTASPRTFEPRGKLKPRVAARNAWKRIEALLQLKTFLTDHQAALEAWRAGDRSVLFPAGTYRMRVFCDVACAGAG